MNRRILILLSLAVFLAAVLFFWDLPKEREEQREQALARRITQLDPALVDTLRLHQPEGLVTLVRRPGGWWLLTPLEEKANDGAALGHIAYLCAAERGRIVSSDVDTLALDAFALGGLRPAELYIELVAPGERLIYWLGRTNPAETFAYLRVGGSRDVVLVDKTLRDAAMTPYEALPHLRSLRGRRRRHPCPEPSHLEARSQRRPRRARPLDDPGR